MGADREDQARRFLELLAALDADRAVQLVTPDYEGSAVAELPLSGERFVYRGPDGLREWIAETARNWGTYRVERLRFRHYGDALLVVGDNQMHGQRNPFGSAEQQRTFVTVFRFDDELIKSVHAYARYEDAVAAEDLNNDSEPS